MSDYARGWADAIREAAGVARDQGRRSKMGGPVGPSDAWREGIASAIERLRPPEGDLANHARTGQAERSPEGAPFLVPDGTSPPGTVPFMGGVTISPQKPPEDGFEEWHRRECPEIDEPCATKGDGTSCNLTRAGTYGRSGYHAYRWGRNRGKRFEGRTCREVYEAERGAGRE